VSFTTDDKDRHFVNARRQVADRIHTQGTSSYIAAAYGGPGKAPYPNYAASVAAVIFQDGRITSILNQGRNSQSANKFWVDPWLNAADTYWVHCFSNNVPNPSAYRVYVCTRLDQAHVVLQRLLQGYNNNSLQFKVAAHQEAQIRNDTIVSWHSSINDARAWGDIASANAAMLEGEAPAGTFGLFNTRAVGIDTEVQGDTSTSRVARAAEAELRHRGHLTPGGFHEV
jgi:hypothetical protein